VLATPAQIADTVASIVVVGVVLAGDLEEVEHQLGVDLPCTWPIEQEAGDLVFDFRVGRGVRRGAGRALDVPARRVRGAAGRELWRGRRRRIGRTRDGRARAIRDIDAA
jgi:hypothetical protein